MSPLIPALGGALLVGGVIGLVVEVRGTPEPSGTPRRSGPLLAGRVRRVDRRTLVLVTGGLAAGVLVAVLTGWLLAIALVPVAAAGLPVLLSAPPSAARIDRLEALEEWTRALSGVLTVGVGLEQALVATLRSTPEEIRPQVSLLVARLRARWATEAALRAFADDLDDAVGDVVAASLILGARRRGAGLAAVLQGLAESVAAEVRARRAVEADRAKSRATARWVTLITITVLAVLALTGDYVRTFATPLGQVILGALLTAYIGVLVWMRRMATGAPASRFLQSHTGVTAGGGGRS